MRTFILDDLHGDHRHWGCAAKHHRVTRFDVLRTMRLHDAQDVAPQKKAAAARHRIPAHRINVIDPIRQHETETRRLVPFAVPRAQIGQR